jgi:peptidoglycan/LPS O-acetylase OafA/YrhL
VEIGNSLGQLGVLLFFVLSGFLITTLIVSEKQENRRIDLARFYWRRALRLVPAFMLFMLVVVVLAVTHKIPAIRAYEFAACFLYIRNIFGRSEIVAHLWSLSLEEQFYILWPPFVSFWNSGRLLIASIMLTAAFCLWRAIAIAANLFDYNSGIYYQRPWFRFDSILMGCCLALLLRNKPQPGVIQKALKRVPVVVIWALLIGWSLVGEGSYRPVYLSLQTLGVTWLLFRAVTGEKFLLLTAPPLKFLGKISYSLYLWQQPFLVAGFANWGAIEKPPINIIVCFLAAIASYFCIEKPFLRLKNKWNLKSKGKFVMAGVH